MSVLSNNNSCIMTAKWDYATSTATGKHTEGREIYRFNTLRYNNANQIEADYGFEVLETRNKVRGMGNTLILRFESTPGKDFELLGWAMDITGTAQ